MQFYTLKMSRSESRKMFCFPRIFIFASYTLLTPNETGPTLSKVISAWLVFRIELVVKSFGKMWWYLQSLTNSYILGPTYSIKTNRGQLFTEQISSKTINHTSELKPSGKTCHKTSACILSSCKFMVVFPADHLITHTYELQRADFRGGPD